MKALLMVSSMLLSAAAFAQVGGRIFDSSNHAVSGVRVIFVDWDKVGHPEEQTVVTDAHGEFVFKHLSPEEIIRPLVLQLPSGDVFASRPSRHIYVPPFGSLRIHAGDPDGAPAGGVKFFPRWIKYGEAVCLLPESMQRQLVATTDQDGNANLIHLPLGWRMDVDVRDDRYSHLRPQPEPAAVGQDRPLGIHLSRAGFINGTVIDADEKPLAGVAVVAQSVRMTSGWGDALTDTNGNFRITQLSPGEYNVAADVGARAADWAIRAAEGVHVDLDHQAPNIIMRLEKGQLVRGTVISGKTKKGIPLIHVGIYGPAHPQSSGWVQMAITDAKGRFQARVPDGDQYIYLMVAMDDITRPIPYAKTITVRGRPATVEFMISEADVAGLPQK